MSGYDDPSDGHPASGTLDLVAVRADLPAVDRLVYLNTGTAGPLPTPVRDAMVTALDADLTLGRASGRRFARFAEHLAETRDLLARLVGADADEIVPTTGTTDGVTRVLAAQPWAAGDRVLVTVLEHPDVLRAVRDVAGRHHATVVVVPGATPEEIGANLSRELAGGARLVVVSHVTYGAGLVLPVPEIVAAARRHRAAVLVDGAQAVGAIRVDVRVLGADYYAFPGQKWLLGPEGVGALVVAHGSAGLPAAAFGPGMPSPVLWEGLRAALGWRERHGTQRFPAAVVAGAAELRRELAGIPQVEVLGLGAEAGLVTIRLPDVDAARVVAALGARRIATREIAETDGVRLSHGPFTTAQERRLVVDAVAELARERGTETW
ncbi:L-cysteine/cystine lyase [Micromonospora pallida]|uniref:L-cysteine/cystine lyase n=1 Tax=Micromonospora pallida TaxID=145854 RepID=A0A1C6S0Q7_9ACTN|nr:aminotransferase class V-fold PLP-dependent enzyme [Micromonospora pallida]SCL22870.1 L-cysteine/cystine lyase [Micromonospora pallida]